MRLKFVTLASVAAILLPALATAQTEQTAPATQARKPASKTPTPSMTTTTEQAAPQSTAPQSTAPGQTQTTPGQSQTSPGQASQLTPAVTGETPSGQSVPDQSGGHAADQAQPGQIVKATAADLKAGASVYDQTGALVGKVVSSTAKGVVIDTGTVQASIPAASFAKGDKGLVISMSKSDVNAAAKPSTAKTTKTTAKTPKKSD
jgi:hypothetical protein